MKILLDTQAFLWMSLDSPMLSKKAKKIILDEQNELYFSLASIWEMAIKTSIGKLIPEKPLEKIVLQQFQENGINQLTIHYKHITKIATLPFHHRDPFDRLLVVQAMEEKLPILSSDAIFDDYNIKRLW